MLIFEKGSTVRIIPQADPSPACFIVYGVNSYEYLIPGYIYDKYLSEDENWGSHRGPVVYSTWRHIDKVGIVLEFIENMSEQSRYSNNFYLVLFGDNKTVVPGERLVDS